LAQGFGVRDGLSAVTRGTLLTLLATLCYIGENFISRVILVRSLTPLQWSAFSLGLTMAGLLVSFGSLGLPSAVARSLPYSSSDHERRGIVRVALLVTILSSGIVSGALFLLGPSIGRALGSSLLGIAIQFFAISVGFTILSGILLAIFQGFEDVRPNAIFNLILNPTLFIVFLVALLTVPPRLLSYNDALLSYVAASIGALLAAIAYASRRLTRHLPRGPADTKVLPKLLTFAVPLFAAGVLGYLTGSADTLILGVYHNVDVGTYTASLTLARLLQIGISSLGYIFLPVAAKFLRERDPGSVRTIYSTATKWMILASLPLFMLFVFLPGASLNFVYGTKYASVTLPLQIVVVGAFIATLAGPSNSAQIAFAQARLLTYNTAISAGCDIGLGLLLIPQYGMVGAAVAWSVSNALWPILSMIELAVLQDVHPFRPHFLIPLAGAAIPLGLVFFFVVPPGIALWLLPGIGIACAGFFVLVVLLTGSIDRGDRLLLEAIEGMIGRPLRLLHRIGRWRVGTN
jgi:O-antigen/teichoic acid export membrane protein